MMRLIVIILCCSATGGSALGGEMRESRYERVEREYDRGAGRVTDDATHQLDLMERSRRPLRPIEQIELDRDRQERIERRQRQVEQSRAMRIPPSPFDLPEDWVDPQIRAVMMSVLAAVERLRTAEAQSNTPPATQPQE